LTLKTIYYKFQQDICIESNFINLMANKLLSSNGSFDPQYKAILHRKEHSMTFEQWTEEMKKGLSSQGDENPKAPSWNYDRLDREMEEEESPNSWLKKS
jgi:hypothetical protein